MRGVSFPPSASLPLGELQMGSYVQREASYPRETLEREASYPRETLEREGSYPHVLTSAAWPARKFASPAASTPWKRTESMP